MSAQTQVLDVELDQKGHRFLGYYGEGGQRVRTNFSNKTVRTEVRNNPELVGDVFNDPFSSVSPGDDRRQTCRLC